MTISECDGDCENTCSGMQTCPLMCDETCLADEMELDDYLHYMEMKRNALCEE